MTAIRWGRGFLRLWLTLSVIWIAATGYTAREDLRLLTQWDVLHYGNEVSSPKKQKNRPVLTTRP